MHGTIERNDHTLTLPWVTSTTSKFVFAGEMRKAFSLALVAGVNMIFSGPGGHAKSEFLTAAMAAIWDADPYVKSFGQGTSTEELYGGIDLDAMNGRDGRKATFQFNPELSFLGHPLAVFEELFDAPSRVLTSLKDTLTARELRNGHQRHPMATKMIAAATNHSPQDIAEGGPEIAALVERFPVQLEVKWDDYGEAAFMAMFDATLVSNQPEPTTVSWDDVAAMQRRVPEVTISRSMQRLLARVIVELRHEGVTVSPRTAMVAVQLVRAAAVINGRTVVVGDDITAIAFLPGVHRLKDRVSQLIEEFSLSVESEMKLDAITEEFNELLSGVAEANIEKLRLIAASIDRLGDEARDLYYVSSLTARRNEVLAQISNGARTVQTAIDTLSKAARDSIRARESVAIRLKGIAREAHSFGNQMWKARTVEEKDGIQAELEFLRMDVEDMPRHAEQDLLRDKVLNGINDALNKRH